MSLLVSFNPDLNFWVSNPQFKILEPFGSVYRDAKGDEQSSNLMWYIAQMEHPDDTINRLARVRERDKRREMLLKDPRYSWIDEDQYEELIDSFRFYGLTSIQQEFKEEKDSLFKLGKLIRETEPTLDQLAKDEYGKVIMANKTTPLYIKGTAEQIMKLRKDTVIVYKKMMDIEADMFKEKSEARIKGGRKESEMEKNEI